MILDLHTHSIASDDGRAKVENYCQWIQKKSLPIDGFVLTEHRQFDDANDYRALEDQFGILILKASEVETEYGHVLVFGVNEDLKYTRLAQTVYSFF
jgi:predicted metal-dependent phosphoesterase TrpH